MNKHQSKPGTLLILLGILLIAAALALIFYNKWDSDRAGEAAASVLEMLPEPETVVPVNPILHKTLENKIEEDPPMAIMAVDGNGYIGTIEVPGLELKLPVMAEWSYDNLEISPCVYSGSYFNGDLVICGHNYSSHFGPLRSISPGADIYLTTVDGYSYHYRVDNIETLQPSEHATMVEPTDWDLTLFTCTTGGQTRCTIRCSLIT